MPRWRGDHWRLRRGRRPRRGYVANWQSYWNHHIALDFGALWSLPVEEQFYFVWPALLMAFFSLRREIKVVVAVLVGWIAAIAVRRAYFWGAGYFYANLYVHTDTRADLLVAVASAGIILALVEGRWAGCRAFELRPMQAIGRISYALYLWHVPVFLETEAHAGGWPTGARIVFAWGLSFGLAIASWKLVEVHFLRLKRGNIAPALPPPAAEPSGFRDG